jgi:hypothetical protein
MFYLPSDAKPTHRDVEFQTRRAGANTQAFRKLAEYYHRADQSISISPSRSSRLMSQADSFDHDPPLDDDGDVDEFGNGIYAGGYLVLGDDPDLEDNEPAIDEGY